MQLQRSERMRIADLGAYLEQVRNQLHRQRAERSTGPKMRLKPAAIIIGILREENATEVIKIKDHDFG